MVGNNVGSRGKLAGTPKVSEENPVVIDSLNEGISSPEETASWYQFIAVFWLTPFVKKAAKEPLQFQDLFALHPVFLTKSSTNRIEDSMKRYLDPSKLPQNTLNEADHLAVDKGEKPRLTAKETQMKWALLKGILYSERKKIILALLLHALMVLSQLCAPIFLSGLLNASVRSSKAYGNMVGLFLCQFVQGLSWNNSQYISRGAAMSVKAALISMVYKKALKLGTKGRMKYPSGVIMNLIASDCAVLESTFQFLSDVFIMPFEITSLSILIIIYAGPAGAAGLAFMILMSAIAIRISASAIKFERKALAATDERVKVTGEVVNGIKIVKFFAWETSFFNRLTGIRDKELQQHIYLRMIGALFSAIMNIVPSFVNVITFSVYRSLGNAVTAAAIFSTLSIVNLIKLPIAIAPLNVQMMFGGLVSLERLAQFLAVEDLEDEGLVVEANTDQDAGSGFAVVVEGATFQWAGVSGEGIDNKASQEESELSEKQSDAFKLYGIDLKVKKGSLTVVVGKVGSGKSSLIQALIGDMIQLNGTAKTFGRIGYSPQAAWLQNSSLRSNILFGSTFDEKRYNQVIQCCSLGKDLQLLSHGDMSEIGEKGVTLSGGQAARVNLACAIYSNADILLFDDPLAAVDSHVGRHILEECILGYCRDKTVILVTHQLHIAHHADHIVVLENGVISEQGSYNELIAAQGGFNALMQEHGRKPSDEEAEEAETTKKAVVAVGETLKEGDKKGNNLTEEEERKTGSVALKYFLFYFRNSGSLAYIGFLLGVFIIWQAVCVFSNFWLTFWVSYRFGDVDSYYMIGLLLIALVQSALISYLTVAFAFACINVGRSLHNKTLSSILRVPMLFFETNPSGRIISRFSKDFTETDRRLPRLFQSVIEMILNLTGTLLLIIYASPWMLIVIAAIIPIYLYILKLYRSSLRELKRIESLERSPLFSQISESFAGMSTIRAFGATEKFISSQEVLQDRAN
ncbi:hypothetical protein HDU79_008643, partial [Rhizoclosmatium sp. JEL0117]